MHDYFEILGVSPDARAAEIRRACARHASRPHPDFLEADRRGPIPGPPVRPETASPVAGLVDVAIDFVDCAEIVERMRAAFFRTGG